MKVISDNEDEQMELLDLEEDFTPESLSRVRGRATWALARKMTVFVVALATVTACVYVVSSRTDMSTSHAPTEDAVIQLSALPGGVPITVGTPQEEDPSCISTRLGFAHAWKYPNKQKTLCVSTNLVGHLAHADEAQWASWGHAGSPVWLMTAYDLEKALLMKKTYGSCIAKDQVNKLLLGIMQMIGYGGNATQQITKPIYDKVTNKITGYQKFFLVIGDRNEFQAAYNKLSPAQQKFQLWQPVFAPTIQGMIGYYGRLGYYVPFLAQRTLTLAYSHLGTLPTGQQNPIGVYSKLSGCTYASMGEDAAKRLGCHPEFYKFQAALWKENCYGECCIQLGYAHLKAEKLDMTPLYFRQLLETCSSCSPYWSGIGLGFSDWPSPFVCTAHKNDPVELWGGTETQMAVRTDKGNDLWKNLDKDAHLIPSDHLQTTKWVDLSTIPCGGGADGFCFDDWKPTRLTNIQAPTVANQNMFCFT